MDLRELNRIMDEKFGAENAIHVSNIVYPDVEELYNEAPANFDKVELAEFYQQFDYVGITNALEIVRNFKEFTVELVTSVLSDIDMHISPSQMEFLKLAYPNLFTKIATNFTVDCPWRYNNV